MRRSVRILLPLIILLGIFLRVSNVYVHNIYPDSYQNLLVAHNLEIYRSVVGYLGKYGMIYPDFFMWTHPVYPLLINLIHLFVPNGLQAAHIAALMAGILAIPVAYFFIKNLLKSQEAGLVAAALIALSFNHTVWSGFTLTETTGVLLVLLLLWSYFSSLSKKPVLFDTHDFVTGILLSLAVFTRYEYTILILPLAIFTVKSTKKPLVRLLNVAVAFVLISAFFMVEFFPLDSTFDVVKTQLPDLYKLGGIIAFFVVVFFGLYLSFRTRKAALKDFISNIILWVIPLIAGYLVLQSLFPIAFTPLAQNTAGLREFYANDLLLGLFLVVGLIRMLQEPRLRSVGLFALVSSIILGAFYYRVNPSFSRYHTHLLSFTIIPAAYGGVFLLKKLHELLKSKKQLSKYLGAALTVILIGLIAWQIMFTSQGIKDWDGGRWMRDNYEEVAAKIVAKKVKKDKLLLVSYPEPYYYFSGVSTYSITDSTPYIYINDSLNDRSILIVQDMGMRYLFPQFSHVLDKKLGEHHIGSFWVHEEYQYLGHATKERHPVMLYEIKLRELKKILSR